MKKKRKQYAPEEKVAILRRHLLEKEPISPLEFSKAEPPLRTMALLRNQRLLPLEVDSTLIVVEAEIGQRAASPPEPADRLGREDDRPRGIGRPRHSRLSCSCAVDLELRIKNALGAKDQAVILGAIGVAEPDFRRVWRHRGADSEVWEGVDACCHRFRNDEIVAPRTREHSQGGSAAFRHGHRQMMLYRASRRTPLGRIGPIERTERFAGIGFVEWPAHAEIERYPGPFAGFEPDSDPFHAGGIGPLSVISHLSGGTHDHVHWHVGSACGRSVPQCQHSDSQQNTRRGPTIHNVR